MSWESNIWTPSVWIQKNHLPFPSSTCNNVSYMEAQRRLGCVICDSLVLSISLSFHLFLYLTTHKKYVIYNALVQISSTASELSSSTHCVLLPSVSVLLWISPWAKEHAAAIPYMKYRHTAFFQSLAIIRENTPFPWRMENSNPFSKHIFCNTQ